MGNLIANGELIENILGAELKRAKALYKQELADFTKVTREVPSAIPYPDNVTRIRRAAERHNHAIDAYIVALRRFNDYTIRGIIPDDLKPSATQD